MHGMAFEIVVDPPGSQAVDHGLFTGAWTLVQESDPRQRWEGKGVQFLPIANVTPTGFSPDPCGDPADDDLDSNALAKDYVVVRPAGWDVTDYCGALPVLQGTIDVTRRAEIALATGVQARVEAELERGVVAGAQPVTLAYHPTILNDVTGSTAAAVGPVKALGLIEDALGNGKGGLGTIHAPTIVVNNWWSKQGVLAERGARIVTHTKGHIVVAGDGYTGVAPTPATGTLDPVDDDQFWIYGTGLCVVRLAALELAEPTRQTIDHRNNIAYGTARQVALAYHDNQRKFAVLVDLTVAG